MGNHDVGRAVGRAAMLAERGRGGETALELLDKVCAPYRRTDAEFEAEDPERPGKTHPKIWEYRDPHPTVPEAALGRLMVEAFGRRPVDEYWREVQDDTEVYWDEVVEPFRKRYGFW